MLERLKGKHRAATRQVVLPRRTSGSFESSHDLSGCLITELILYVVDEQGVQPEHAVPFDREFGQVGFQVGENHRQVLQDQVEENLSLPILHLAGVSAIGERDYPDRQLADLLNGVGSCAPGAQSVEK